MLSTGFDTEGLSSAVWPGGETEALTRLERHLERKVGEFTRKLEEKCIQMKLQVALSAPPSCTLIITNRVSLLWAGVGGQL